MSCIAGRDYSTYSALEATCSDRIVLMSYRSAPPDASQPVYHGSAFPWSVAETAGAVHVGDHAQAMDMVPRKPNKSVVSDALGGARINSLNDSGPSPVLLRKGGKGGDTYTEREDDGTKVRAFSPPPSVPNGGMTELSFNPGVGFHDVDVSDKTANTAHLLHARENDYARGGSIDQSAVASPDLSHYAQPFDKHSTPGVLRHNATHENTYDALQALRENKVLRYANVMEGDGTGVSYVVPNPDLNLRQYGEEPKMVAGKEYHQTPLPGIDLAGVRNPGPFDEHFDDGGPNYVSLGDRRAPNMSRTRRRTQNVTDSTTSRPRDFKDEPLF